MWKAISLFFSIGVFLNFMGCTKSSNFNDRQGSKPEGEEKKALRLDYLHDENKNTLNLQVSGNLKWLNGITKARIISKIVDRNEKVLYTFKERNIEISKSKRFISSAAQHIEKTKVEKPEETYGVATVFLLDKSNKEIIKRELKKEYKKFVIPK